MLAKAKNWQDLNEASKLFGAPGQNWTFADKNGNIGWRPSSKIPIRKNAEMLIPFDGSTSEFDWKGYVPFEKMPFLYSFFEMPPRDIGGVLCCWNKSLASVVKAFLLHRSNIIPTSC